MTCLQRLTTFILHEEYSVPYLSLQWYVSKRYSSDVCINIIVDIPVGIKLFKLENLQFQKSKRFWILYNTDNTIFNVQNWYIIRHLIMCE